MIFIGFLWSFAMVCLSLIVLTLLGYAFPDSIVGKTASIIK